MFFNDTIVAQITPYGKSAVGIIRVSGVLSSLVSLKILKIIPKPKIATYLSFFDLSNNIIDKGIALWFPGPNSFTGEDVLELQTHGSPILLNLLIDIITSIKNIRIARKGEFSERAFLNKKIDLIQAEAINDLINSRSEIELKCSLKSLHGFFSKYIKNIIQKIIVFRSEIEVRIDFFENEEEYFLNLNIEKNIDNIIFSINKIINMSNNSKILKNGIKIVLAGPPNVGKSSIFNKLLFNNRSIVTNIKGTTRDTLHENFSINGVLFELVDTAGIHETDNVIENIGIKRAIKEIKNADYIFFVIDINLNNFIQLQILSKFLSKLLIKKNFLIILNKFDLYNKKKIIKYKIKGIKYIYISTLNNLGIDLIRKFLIKKTKLLINNEANFIVKSRHLNILKSTKNFLLKIKKKWILSRNIELLAEDLFFSQKLLNEIYGSVTSKKIISYIFSNFCIGK
ncbi:tRNA uridine-5-carboxymethylaminomethyl(34) synthesis GTPase MnmE [Buchnera aphidicola]|uniref:tRNA uridine-5-carboxymethylaminomethyl(34) synthesis GTPase MnmE n=1 Tax=Buchnera aphidicola TaxID=9 RepID=UPI0031B7FC15